MSKIIAFDGPGIARRLYHSRGSAAPLVEQWAEMIRTLLKAHTPTHWLCGWDSYEDSWRRAMYPRYKANRQPAPHAYNQQLPQIGAWCESVGLPVISAKGNEADDVLGSLAEQLPDSDQLVMISDDKDLRQAVMKYNVTLATMRGKTWTRDRVRNAMGVWPNDLADYYALVGDRVDGIPGAWRVGDSKARQLIARHRTIEKMEQERVAGVWNNAYVKTYRDVILLNLKIDVLPSVVPIPEGFK